MRPTRQGTEAGHTYFVTSQTWQRRTVFSKPAWAELFISTLQGYRGRAYQLHEYVLMPEHFHILITPSVTLERAVQFIKGGFSFRAKKELESNLEIWQSGFSDHRLRGAQDYSNHVRYIFRNPVGRQLVERAEEYPYCSAFPGSLKDEAPQWLKPLSGDQAFGAAKAGPLQEEPFGGPEGPPLPKTPEGISLQEFETETVATK